MLNLKQISVLISGLVLGFWMGSAPVRLEQIPTTDLVLEIWRRHFMEILAILLVLVIIHMPYYLRMLRWFFRSIGTLWFSIKYRFNAAASDVKEYSGVRVETAIDALRYIPEKYQAGSEYFSQQPPPFQVSLSVRNATGEGWVVVGQGYRMADWLVTAYHVVANYDFIRIIGKGGHADIDVSRCKDLGYDVCIGDLATNEWLSIGARSASIPKQGLIHQRQVVTICGKDQASNGVLSEYTSIPYLMYQGSTMPGFSGAPLYVGSAVYGMHVGAGSSNLAIDSNFIESLVRKVVKVDSAKYKAEDSEDIVFDKVWRYGRAGKKSKAFLFAPGEISILVDGRYYNVDAELLPEDVFKHLEFEPSRSKSYRGETLMDGATFDGIDTASLNLKTASAVVEARRLKEGVPVPQKRLQIPAITDSLMMAQDMKSENMIGQRSIHVQPNEALPSTVRSQRRTRVGATTVHRELQNVSQQLADLKASLDVTASTPTTTSV